MQFSAGYQTHLLDPDNNSSSGKQQQCHLGPLVQLDCLFYTRNHRFLRAFHITYEVGTITLL